MGGIPVPHLLKVNDVYPAIQGEGCQAGVAMVVLRLQGCGVGCPWCDTKETWLARPEHQVPTLADALGTSPRYALATPAEVADFVATHAPGPRWVLLTGGEPAEQTLGPLVAALHRKGYRVAIETSGTALGHLGAMLDWVCVSPKFDMPGGRPVLDDAFRHADEIKMVVGTAADLARLDEFLARLRPDPAVQICLQPVSLSKKATELCTDAAIRRGWRVSIQVHKYLEQR